MKVYLVQWGDPREDDGDTIARSGYKLFVDQLKATTYAEREARGFMDRIKDWGHGVHMNWKVENVKDKHHVVEHAVGQVVELVQVANKMPTHRSFRAVLYYWVEELELDDSPLEMLAGQAE